MYNVLDDLRLHVREVPRKKIFGLLAVRAPTLGENSNLVLGDCRLVSRVRNVTVSQQANNCSLHYMPPLQI